VLQSATAKQENAMTTVNVRKQGGVAVVTIPANMMKMLHIEVGSTLELDVSDGVLTARPAANKRRYTLSELLRGVTPAKMDKLKAETEWAHEGESVGRELA
jgi:antitoxin ChpS